MSRRPSDPSMRRIVIIGSGGSGKSTLAREMGARLGLPVLHLDRLFWRAGWVETLKDEWGPALWAHLDRPAWVMDGNFGGTLDMRLAAADTVVFLDLSRWLCIARVLRRRLRYRRRARPDMAEGCPEKLDIDFLAWIWNYPGRSRPRVLARLASVAPGTQVVVLHSRAEVARFVDGLAPAPP